MLMRYHWGLAIGHLYSHDWAATMAENFLDFNVFDRPLDHESYHETQASSQWIAPGVSKGINPNEDEEELEPENQKDDDWEDVEMFCSEDEEDEDPQSDDDHLMAMDEMYGSQ